MIKLNNGLGYMEVKEPLNQRFLPAHDNLTSEVLQKSKRKHYESKNICFSHAHDNLISGSVGKLGNQLKSTQINSLSSPRYNLTSLGAYKFQKRDYEDYEDYYRHFLHAHNNLISEDRYEVQSNEFGSRNI